MRWLVPLLLVVGCYSPSYRDCEVTCASGQCPAGLRCDNGVCRLPGMTGACGTTGDVPMDASRGVPLELYGEARATAMCEYLVRCGAAEAVESCVEVLQSLAFVLGPVINAYDNQIAAVAAGKALYHPEKAADCLQEFATQSCDRRSLFSPGPLACSEMFSGTLGADAPCAIGETCISQFCMTTSCTSNGCCTGTCVGSKPPALLQLTQPCTYRDRCENGYCDTTNANGAVCTPFKAQAEPCSSTGQCMDGLLCRPDAAGMLTCQQPVENLGACNSTQDCRLLSNVCSGNKCDVGGLQGFACPTGTECQLYHGCINGSCALPPALQEPCTPNQSCRTGYCDGVTCVPQKADDTQCDPTRGGQDCESGFCDSTSGLCASRPVCF